MAVALTVSLAAVAQDTVPLEPDTAIGVGVPEEEAPNDLETAASARYGRGHYGGYYGGYRGYGGFRPYYGGYYGGYRRYGGYGFGGPFFF